MKQLSKNSFAIAGNSGGTGGALSFPNRQSACISLNLVQGWVPDNISNATQPRDQMSTLAEYPLPLITSGAIQKTEPWRDMRELYAYARL